MAARRKVGAEAQAVGRRDPYADRRRMAAGAKRSPISTTRETGKAIKDARAEIVRSQELILFNP